MSAVLLASVLYATAPPGYAVECVVYRMAMQSRRPEKASFRGVPERIPPTRATPMPNGESYCLVPDPLPGELVMFCARSVDPNDSSRVSECTAPAWPAGGR